MGEHAAIWEGSCCVPRCAVLRTQCHRLRCDKPWGKCTASTGASCAGYAFIVVCDMLSHAVLRPSDCQGSAMIPCWQYTSLPHKTLHVRVHTALFASVLASSVWCGHGRNARSCDSFKGASCVAWHGGYGQVSHLVTNSLSFAAMWSPGGCRWLCARTHVMIRSGIVHMHACTLVVLLCVLRGTLADKALKQCPCCRGLLLALCVGFLSVW